MATVNGTILNDNLNGTSGDDLINGGLGADNMWGLQGNDTYVVDNLLDKVYETASQGIDVIRTTINYTLPDHVENLLLEGSLLLIGTGNGLSNFIYGNAMNNTLDGKAGADTLQGGAGDDWYYVDQADDVIVEASGQGNDTVWSSANHYTLGAAQSLEFLVLLDGGNIGATGNELANTLNGNSGNNILSGAGGDDVISGWMGSDVIYGDEGHDILNGGWGTDTLEGGVGNDIVRGDFDHDFLFGGWGIDTLESGEGNDSLDGGSDADSMQGGLGNDTYVVDNENDQVSETAASGSEGSQGDIVRLSIGPAGQQAEGASYSPAFSGNGAFMVFGSSANNLVSGDTNSWSDIFRKDLASGSVVRINISATGVQGDREGGYDPDISQDGNLIAFQSYSTNHVSGDTNSRADIFVKNVSTGAMVRASTDASGAQANNYSESPDLSEDGTRVVFTSLASNLVAGDTNSVADIFMKEMASGAISRLSTDSSGVQANGASSNPVFSASGSHVVFVSSASNLVAGDTNNVADIFVRNLSTGAVVRASTDASGVQANGASSEAVLSADGTKVLFKSSATNLVAGDTNGRDDIFLKDLATGSVVRVSVDSMGGQSNGHSRQASFSSDGSRVVFISNASNLDVNDINVSDDVYVKNIQTGRLVLMSAGESGLSPGASISEAPVFHPDGKTVAFSSSFAFAAGDTNGQDDIYAKTIFDGASEGIDTVRSLLSHTLSVNVENLELTGSDAIDGEGNRLANLLRGNDQDNILEGRELGDTIEGGLGSDTATYRHASEGVSVNLAGGRAEGGRSVGLDILSGIENIQGSIYSDLLRGDGGANRLDGNGGPDRLAGGGGNDTYIVDHAGDVVDEHQAPVITRINTGISGGQATGSAWSPVFLSDGVRIAFVSDAPDLVAGDDNGIADLFFKNIVTGHVERFPLSMAGAPAISISQMASIEVSPDGQFLLFDSPHAYIAGDTNMAMDVYKINLNDRSLARISTDATGQQTVGGAGVLGNSGQAVFSPDGQSVMFLSDADNLVAGGGPGMLDIYLKNLTSGAVQLISAVAPGLPPGVQNYQSNNPVFSPQGNWVGFSSDGPIVSNGAFAPGVMQLYVRNLATGLALRVSSDSQGNIANASSEGLVFSQDGTKVAFTSSASNLVAGDTNLGSDVFVKNVQSGSIIRVNTSLDGEQANGASYRPVFSPDGNLVAFISSASNLVAGDNNAAADVFIKNLTTGVVQRVNLTTLGLSSSHWQGVMQQRMSFSPDGTKLLFVSSASDLVANDSNMSPDIFMVDLSVIDSGGVDLVESSVSFTLSSYLENLRLSGAAALNGVGNAENNHLMGNDGTNALHGEGGNDTLTGGLGVDSLHGGMGDDIYYLDAHDVVVELADGGIDEIQADFNVTLADHVEKLVLLGGGNISASGNVLANYIYGNTGNNSLDGGGGSDTLAGGLGDDTYQLDFDGVLIDEKADEGIDLVRSSVTIVLGSFLENLSLTGAGHINGTGNSLANLITGNDGHNRLDGKAGADTMMGGLGNDTYILSAGDVVVENADGGIDEVQAGFSYTLSSTLENMVITGAAHASATGNSLANHITGNSGNNLLDGKAGADTMTGGAGNDTYVVSSGDVVVETLAGGVDDVRVGFSYTLGADLENLQVTGIANASATGNGLNNIITGNSGNNLLDGKSGADTMSGGAGNDTYVLSSGDVIVELAGGGVDEVRVGFSYTLGAQLENVMVTGAANVSVTGNDSANSILGNNGANRLSGGLGNDSLTGGAGNDSYVLVRGDGADTITDTDALAGNSDRLWFNDISISHDQLWFRQAGNDLEVSVIGTGDKALVKNWYVSPSHRVEEIRSGNGKTLLSVEVEALVSAMSGLTPPPLGQTTLNAAQHAALDAVIAANWS